MNPGELPITREAAIRIVLHIFEAVDVLLDTDQADASSTARLANHGDDLLDRAQNMPGVEIHRSIAIAIALSILDDGIIPLEVFTQELSLALELTEDYDFLMNLIRLWP